MNVNTSILREKDQRRAMMALLIILLMIIALDMASLHWGVDSTDGINSLEWLRRQLWYGFH